METQVEFAVDEPMTEEEKEAEDKYAEYLSANFVDESDADDYQVMRRRGSTQAATSEHRVRVVRVMLFR